MKKSRFLSLLSFLFLVLLFSGCKLSLSNFTAPEAANTSSVIVLDLEGTGEPTGTSTIEYGLALQVPESWQIISGKALLSPPGLSTLSMLNYKIEENKEYKEYYRAEPGYKVWVGTCTPFSDWPQDVKLTAKVNVVVGDFEGEDGETRDYHLKMAAGALRNGVWVTDAPQDQFDFAAITDKDHVKSITVTKVTSPFDNTTPVWETYQFDHPFYGIVHAPTDGHFYVVQGNNQILELGADLTDIATIAIDAAVSLTSITYLGGYLWVGDARGAKHVYKFDLYDQTSQAFAVSSFPDGIGTDGQYVYVVDQDSSGVLNIVDPVSGEKVKTLKTLVQDPVGITYDGGHLLVLDESGAIYRVDSQTGDTSFLFFAPGAGDDNTYYGAEGISYIAGYLVVGYGLEDKIVIGELGMQGDE